MAVLAGLICGSFANVLIARLPRRESILWPGSRCPECRTPLKWYDNVPILGFLVLKGKCRTCKHPISTRYPLVELLTALLFLATMMKFGPSVSLFVRDWPLLVMLVTITFIDLDHRIIPDRLSIGGAAWGLVCSLIFPDAWPTYGWQQALLGAAAGFFGFYLVAWIYSRRSGRAGLGGGDIKLLAMLGAFFGPGGVFVTVLISSILGSVVGITWALASGEKNLLKASIPYGPFLVLGALYYYLLGDILWLPFTIPT
ncbi:MAG: hypothetical protein A2X94_15070 [Bdellovibrionales bacterium GWB1_55_8]|nr:MAG: hypothetical protein A2X94_15070 [Bdellovibrionales bacterium GWB1_55_8]